MSFKKALVLFSLILLRFTLPAQDLNMYDTLFKRVDEMVNKKGLSNSALTEVKKIYALAKKQNQDVQLIKALIYQANIQQMFQEDATIKNINDLENELKTLAEPSASILKSILA